MLVQPAFKKTKVKRKFTYACASASFNLRICQSWLDSFNPLMIQNVNFTIVSLYMFNPSNEYFVNRLLFINDNLVKI